MKTAFIFLALLISSSSFAVQPQHHKPSEATSSGGYITKFYRGFKLERFPTKYAAHPVKTQTKTFQGKLLECWEVNALGNTEGFYLSMFNWGCPETITYYLGDLWVYQATFFPNSRYIEKVENYNLEHKLRGWQIKRIMNDDERTYTEHNVFIDNNCIITIIDNKKLSLEDIQLQKSTKYDRDALCNKYDKSGTISSMIFVASSYYQL